MIMKTTKKVGVFLSVISVYGSMTAINNKLSTTVLSDAKVKIGTALAGFACAGFTMLAKSDNNLDTQHILLTAGASVCSAIGAYLCLNKLTPEEQLKAYESAKGEIAKHKIFETEKNTTEYKKISLDSKITAILQMNDKQEKKTALQALAKRKYAKNAGAGNLPILEAVNDLCKLEGTIINERHRLKAIIDSDAKERDAEKERKQLKELKRLIEAIREPLLENHDEMIKTRSKMEGTEVKKQQFTYASKIGIFIPMFIQPVSTLCMVLLQLIFQKFGIQLQ